MTDPYSRMSRIPALFPLLVALCIVLVASAGAVWLSARARTTVIVLVRHAEPLTVTTGDPDLSPEGERRATQLGAALADALPGRAVDRLYAADTRRAQQTAASVANQFKLPINLLAASDWPGLANRIRDEHRGETVVVVGYASTLPGVLNQLSASQISLEPNDFGSIYVVVMPSPGQPRTVRLRYGDSSAPEEAEPVPEKQL